MAKSVTEWIKKYKEKIDKVDWDAAASEWESMKRTFIDNYTSTEGLNPRIAAKYRRNTESASYRKPDPSKMKKNYEAKMKAP